MKNVISFIFLLALLVSGCSQEEMLKNGTTSVSGKGRIFTTEFEQNDSRTYVENGLYSRWTEGDCISLFDASTLNCRYLFAGDTGDSGGTFSLYSKPEGTSSGLNTNYAVYPYSEDVKMTEDGVISVTLPSEQHYAENSYGVGDNTMVAVTHNVYDTFLKFKNVGGCLKLQLYGDNVRVKSITLTGNKDERIAGKATITAAYDKVPIVAMADNATNSITLNCNTYSDRGVWIGETAEEATTFWLVLPPVIFEEGITITVTDNKDKVFTQITNNRIVIERNVVKPMAAVLVEPSHEIIPEEFIDSYLSASILIDGEDVADFYEDCYVSSIYDKVPVSNERLELQSNINEKVQIYFLTDNSDNIYMMSRVSNTEEKRDVEFNAERTALAFVTFHPLFASIDGLAYEVLEEAILQSKNFPKVRTEIENIIKQKQDLFNQSNSTLYDALDLLLDELVVFSSVNDLISRAIINETQYYPFKINSEGTRLDFQVFGLNPNYYGTATHANGKVEKLVVQSHDDFGFLAGLESIWNILNHKGWDVNQYGDIESYTFPEDGECQFHFSCKTEENQMDLIARLFSSASDMLGIDVDESMSGIFDIYNDLSTIVQEVNNASYKLGTTTFPFFKIAKEIAIDRLVGEATDLINASIEQSYEKEIAVYEKLKSTTNNQNIVKAYNDRIKVLKNSKALFKKAMGTYTLTKGIGNMVVRLIAAQRASDPVDFKLCCYNNEIRNCTQFMKYKGDNQTGIYGVELDEPISVAINVNMGKLSDFAVKFEVCEGGGSVSKEYIELGNFDYTVSTKWTMGSYSEEQMVRAYLCEKESGEEVCEPVEFTAKAIEKLDIYIESGDDQMGPENTALPEKLQVGLDDYELFDNSKFRVQFEVVKGSGSVSPQYAELSGGIAGCEWVLGDEDDGEQLVKAVLVSNANKREISDPIYFESNFEDEDDKPLREALIELYRTTDGDNWYRNTNWCSGKPLVEWYGVTKDENGLYTVTLQGNNLNGYVDLDIPEVKNLKSIVLSVYYGWSTREEDQLSLVKIKNEYIEKIYPPITTKEIDVSGCSNLKQLGPAGLTGYGFRSLERLNMSYCPSLTEVYVNLASSLASFDASYCESLSILDIYQSENLTSFDIKGCSSLSELNLTFKSLNNLNLTGYKQLESVHLQGDLNSLDVSGLDLLHLGFTDIYDGPQTNISSINASNCQKLTELYVYEINLNSLKVNNCKNLIRLSCEDNNLVSLDLSGCENLKSLDCQDNELSSLNVSSCTLLESLICSNNNLGSLDVSSCTLLEYLSCHDNNLGSLDISNCYALTSVYCYNNNISGTIDISNCNSLKRLECQNNKISFLKFPDSYYSDGVIKENGYVDSKIVPLEYLDCSYNLILQECPKWFSFGGIYGVTTHYDVRYEYFYDDKDWETGYVPYEDKGVGWWFSGEPERRYHRR